MTHQALGHITLLTYAGAVLSMALKDALGTLLVVAEARGRSLLAGFLDAGGDAANIFVTLLGAGEIVVHGFTAQTFGILAAIMVTSFCGTVGWVRLANRWMPANPSPVVELPSE